MLFPWDLFHGIFFTPSTITMTNKVKIKKKQRYEEELFDNRSSHDDGWMRQR